LLSGWHNRRQVKAQLGRHKYRPAGASRKAAMKVEAYKKIQAQTGVSGKCRSSKSVTGLIASRNRQSEVGILP